MTEITLSAELILISFLLFFAYNGFRTREHLMGMLAFTMAYLLGLAYITTFSYSYQTYLFIAIHIFPILGLYRTMLKLKK